MLPRKLFERIKEQRKDKKISIILGPRQVGKTTLLKELYKELSKTNKCLFLDLDILSNYEKISTFENLINTLKLNGYKESEKDFYYLFLDEFQKYINLANIMKNVYDNFDNIKIYASSSSSLVIKDQVQESLAGRKKVNELFALDFEEFLWFKQDDKIIEKLNNAKNLEGDGLYILLPELNHLLEEFLIFGGYPGVVLKNTKEEKIEVLESIFDLYAKKDLISYLHIEKILDIKNLIEYLAVNHGQKIKYEEISEKFSLRYKEVKNYIEILKETYLVYLLKPFYTNKNKELVKIPKVYFIDNGVRNFFIKNFNEISLRNDIGFLFEGFVLSELIKKGIKNIKFWQDKNKTEVDFIIDNISLQIPLEVKFKQNIKSDDFNGLDAFMKEYPKTKKKYLINLNTQKDIEYSLILPYSLEKIKTN
ncbi:MAG: ATP-binding protein [archaeon]